MRCGDSGRLAEGVKPVGELCIGEVCGLRRGGSSASVEAPQLDGHPCLAMCKGHRGSDFHARRRFGMTRRRRPESAEHTTLDFSLGERFRTTARGIDPMGTGRL